MPAADSICQPCVSSDTYVQTLKKTRPGGRPTCGLILSGAAYPVCQLKSATGRTMMQRRRVFVLFASAAIGANVLQASPTGDQRQSSQVHVAWVAEVLKRMQTIKPGECSARYWSSSERCMWTSVLALSGINPTRNHRLRPFREIEGLCQDFTQNKYSVSCSADFRDFVPKTSSACD